MFVALFEEKEDGGGGCDGENEQPEQGHHPCHPDANYESTRIKG
jgi:hypothetical protein